ncbi:LysR family transcriptional regulator [Shewanella sp. NFH-SH190041]|uniref:LysR family transcriptional regulator n=1 Tax=Shewanella sp. NFH-SH190041 TaxID=2950245 RepID=UPI0021C3F139|nr:LysR family transcriptional regulator [Shewanella sp. NFH-SH190041]BDM63225.1 LysR family transcriptional regulator [Shewanella sp. NFH-SH190041]
MYSFEQLSLFLAVCDCGSFSAAARKFKRAQSGVSQAIANLEIALDQTLFDRSGNTPVLTEAGQALAPIARALLEQKQFFDQKVSALEAQQENELTIIIDESLADAGVLEIIAQLIEHYPTTHFNIQLLSSFDAETQLVEAKAQLAIVYQTGEMKTSVDFLNLGHIKFITVCAPFHPLAALPKVKATDLTAQRQLVHQSMSEEQLWFSDAITPKVTYANSHQLLINLAQKGLGWTLVPEAMVNRQLQDSTLVRLPIAHEPNGWITAVGALISRQRQPGPITAQLIQALVAHFAHP